MSYSKIRLSKKGIKGKKPRAVYFPITIWREKKDKHIHITIPSDKDANTYINNRKGSPRYHKDLYNKLRKLLKSAGRWY